MAIADGYASEVMPADSHGALTPTPQTWPSLRSGRPSAVDILTAATVRRISLVMSVSMMPGSQYDRVVGKES